MASRSWCVLLSYKARCCISQTSFTGANGRALQVGGLVQQVLEVVGVTDEMRLYRR